MSTTFKLPIPQMRTIARMNPAFARVNSIESSVRVHGYDVVLEAQYQSQIATQRAIAENASFAPWHPFYSRAPMEKLIALMNS